jgi:hypothetical protein
VKNDDSPEVAISDFKCGIESRNVRRFDPGEVSKVAEKLISTESSRTKDVESEIDEEL